MAVIPNTNVSMTTIRDTLNSAGGSVGNGLTSFFSSNAKLNPYSKHKPVVLAKNFCQDFDSSKSDYDATWWLGTSRLCGLSVMSLTNAEKLPSAYDGNMNGWAYIIPSGGDNAPMRLGDFCGYDTDATPPMYNFKAFNMINTTNADEIAMSIYVVGNASNSVSFLNMPSISDYYLGVCLEHKTTGGCTCNSQTTRLAEGNNFVTINPYLMRDGEYNVYPFISEEAIRQGGEVTVNTIYTIPGITPLSLRIYSSASAYVVTLDITSATAFGLDISFSVRNNTSSQKTFTNNFIRVRMQGVDFDEPLTFDDYEEALDNFSVNAGATYTQNITIPLMGYPELQQAGVVYLSLDSADIIKDAEYEVNFG